eukprot:scaffold237484_cov51-Prasinocladus_malaysianus.AAC.1
MANLPQKVAAWLVWKHMMEAARCRSELEADMLALKLLALADTKLNHTSRFLSSVAPTLKEISPGPALDRRLRLLAIEIECMKKAGFSKESMETVLSNEIK